MGWDAQKVNAGSDTWKYAFVAGGVWRAALTAGYKDYRDADAGEWSLAPTVRYRLGDGVEFLPQYRYTDRSGDLARAVGYGEEHRIEAGLSFDFESVFNDYIGERDSILNLEHGYVR